MSWREENYETLHFNAVIGEKMEVDFAGQTFSLVNRLTGEISSIVVFVAVLPYSQYIYVNITVRRSRQSGVARATCPD